MTNYCFNNKLDFFNQIETKKIWSAKYQWQFTTRFIIPVLLEIAQPISG